MRKEKNILAIDWWTKYLWLAYVKQDTNVVIPIWSLMNDWGLFFSIWDILTRYGIKKIVVWYPDWQENIQKRIDEFVNQLQYIVDEEIEIERVDEHYSSVQAWAVDGHFEKDEKQDTLAAMKILETYINNQ